MEILWQISCFSPPHNTKYISPNSAEKHVFQHWSTVNNSNIMALFFILSYSGTNLYRVICVCSATNFGVTQYQTSIQWQLLISFTTICDWILHIWNVFYTRSQSKISLLSPLIIGSKLTFISRSGRWLPTIKPCSKSPQLLVWALYHVYMHNIKPKLSAKHVFTVREWFQMVF